jgi:xanthine dehydrogenase YagS FAD-binding subunit
MKAFEFLRPRTLQAAAAAMRDSEGALLKAGGIDVIERMKERLDEPERIVGLVDVGDEARAIRVDGDRISVGALATLADVASSEEIREHAEGLAEAAAEAASPQIRNLATVAGNLAQHTRCGYYRHRSFPCFKRGDEKCPVHADGAVQEQAGVFANDPCACAHPSSLAPVFGALGAEIAVRGEGEPRRVPFSELWRAPTRGVAADIALGPAEVIDHVVFPVGAGSTAYEEVRQKAAFDWALVSCGVRLVKAGAKIESASVWLGAVAPTPWRCASVETVLQGNTFTSELAAKAGEAAADGATPLSGTRYKVPLVQVAVKRALLKAWERA